MLKSGVKGRIGAFFKQASLATDDLLGPEKRGETLGNGIRWQKGDFGATKVFVQMRATQDRKKQKKRNQKKGPKLQDGVYTKF